MRKTMACLLFFLVLLLAVSVAGETIRPGEVRTAVGTVSAVDIQSSALVVETPTAKGDLTVGVTMKKDAPIMRKGKNVGLRDLKVGETVTVKYGRDGDMLVGLEVRAR
jgi:hypothetical protein